ncbi:MAG: 1 protein [Ignavibacteria bacterium]|nr:1 protein [Ignavibacteria bacterium]
MSQLLCNISFDRDIPQNASALIYHSIQLNRLDDFIILLPTGKAVQRLSAETIRLYYKSTGKPSPKPSIYTLQGFVSNIFSRLFDSKNYRLISDAYRLALFEEAIEKSQLKFFISKDKTPSHAIVQKLASIIYGLREDGIKPGDIEKDIILPDNIISEVFDIERLKDVHRVYEKYIEILGDYYLDFPRILELVTTKLKTQFTGPSLYDELFPEKSLETEPYDKLFPIKKYIVVYGFSEFRLPEQEFLACFARSPVPLAVHIDYSDDNGPLFGNLKNTVQKLKSEGLMLKSSTTGFSENISRSHYLRRWLFNTEKEIQNVGFSEIIQIIKTPDRINEVKTIAKMVKNLVTLNSIPVSDICICSRRPELYSNLFREIFSDYTMVPNITDRFRLAESPPVIAIFSVLKIISEGFRIEDVHSALGNPYLSFKSGNRKPDGDNIYECFRKLRFLGGKRYGAEFLQNRLEKASISNQEIINRMQKSGVPDFFELKNVKSNLESMNSAIQDFKVLRESLDLKKSSIEPLKFESFIKEKIIKQLKLNDNILKSSTAPAKQDKLGKAIANEAVEKDCRALSAFIEVLEDMTFVLENRFPGKKFPFDELLKKLSISLSGAKYQIHEKRNFGITVTSIEQTRDYPYRAMFLCGAVDGEFPLAYRTESFLGKELRDSRQLHIQAERMLFYQFLANDSERLDSGEKRIYISYPETDETSRLVRSPFIESLLKITSGVQEYDFSKDEFPYLISNLNQNHEIAASKREVLSLASKEYIKHRNIESFDNSTRHVFEALFGNIQNYFIYLDNLSTGKTGLIKRDSLSLTASDSMQNISGMPVSATDLDSYSACPYKFYANRIMRLEKTDYPEKALSALEKGSLLHLILYKFFTSLQRQSVSSIEDTRHINSQLPLLKKVALEPERFDEYYNILKSICEEELAGIEFANPFFESEKNLLLGTPQRLGILGLWLRLEIERQQSGFGFYPALFELDFGLGKTTSLSTNRLPPVELGEGLRLRGKIDRVDISDSHGLQFIIADYKTKLGNSLPGDREIINGESFQMPLYIYAMKNIIRDYYLQDSENEGAVYIGLIPEYDSKSKKYKTQKFVMLSKSSPFAGLISAQSAKKLPENEEMIDALIEKVISNAKSITESIAGGDFRAKPDAKVCRYCNFHSLCRVGIKE